MKKFLLRAFAVMGVLFSLLIAIGIVLGSHFWHSQQKPKAPEAMILVLDLSKSIVEQEKISPLNLAMQFEHRGTSLLTILGALEHAKNDKRIKAVVARFGDEQPSLAQAEEIRSALLHFKDSGKPTYAYSTSFGEFGHGNRSYYLASTFNEIWLQPVGTVGLTGLSIEAPFGKTALGQLGISADFFQREEYKSAMENMTRDNFSQPARTEMQGMMDSLAGQLANGIAEGRKWDVAKVKLLMSQGPFTANEAQQNGLITKLGYDDELVEQLKQKLGKDIQQVDADAYSQFIDVPKKPKATVALITGVGMITDAPDGAGRLTGDSVMDAETIANAFHQATEDKDIKAIIFRINSPGGSPVASETIRHALIKAKLAHKPVFVSMGELAASGGYWVAMDADKIFADPATLTGSIGVIAGKFVLGGLFEKLGVKWDGMATSENAKMFSPLTMFDVQGRARMNALLDDTYHSFVTAVSTARKIPLEKMPEVAKGRVWTGEQAVKIGLVDQLGGLDDTVQAMKQHIGLNADDVVMLELLPTPPTAAELLLKLLHSFGEEEAVLHDFSSIIQSLKIQSLMPNHPISVSMPAVWYKQ